MIQSTVRVRDTPGTSGAVVGYLYKNDQVTILEETNSYWYKNKNGKWYGGVYKLI
ncbi:SH3 domain-containing protein [Paenibacillus rhizoplanae]